MAEGLFLVGKIKANAMLGYRSIRALVSGSKKRIVVPAALLALFVAPLAVSAYNGSLTWLGDDPEQGTQPWDQPSQTKSESPKNDDINNQGTSSGGAQSGEASSSNNSQVDVSINGQAVPVPENGHIHKEMTDGNSHTVVDVHVDGSSTSDSRVQSSTSVHINSNNHSSGSDSENCDRLIRCR